jgi:two-component system, OmpR family, response regulator RegX3
MARAVASIAAMGDGRHRVLLVEDDASLAEGLAEGLARYGFDADTVATGRAALDAPVPDVVLLDLGLPDIDGLDVCRELRSRSDVPIIVITARAEETDRVVGLELGADDYLAKPFPLRELVARIRAVLRRVAPSPRPRPAGPEVVELGRLKIDHRERRVLVDGEEVALAPREHDLLAKLASDPGALFTREELMSSVWDENWFGSTRTLNVHVGGLRTKLGGAVAIEAVRGVGYRLTLP